MTFLDFIRLPVSCIDFETVLRHSYGFNLHVKMLASNCFFVVVLMVWNEVRSVISTSTTSPTTNALTTPSYMLPIDPNNLINIPMEKRNGTVDKAHKFYFYVENGFRSQFPDGYTFRSLGYNFPRFNKARSYFIQTLPFTPIPFKSLYDHHTNQKFMSLGNSSFILKTEKVFPKMLNPAYTYWNGNIVVSWRHAAEIFRIVHIDREELYRNSTGYLGTNTNRTRTSA